MSAMPGTRPTGAALKAASVGGGPEVAAAASSAQRQRAQVDAIKSRRKPAPAQAPADRPEQPAPPPASPGGGPPAAFTDQTGSPGWYRGVAGANPVAVGNAGGGFLLGVALWAVGLAYLRNGSTGVRQLLAAKFLNRPATS